MLLTRNPLEARSPSSSVCRAALPGCSQDDRPAGAFLKRSGVAAGAGRVSLRSCRSHDRQSRRRAADKAARSEVKRTVCTHCSVGCAIDGGGAVTALGGARNACSTRPSTSERHCAQGARSRCTA